MSDNIINLPRGFAVDASKRKANNSGEPPNGGDSLEKRVEKLESSFLDIREKLARVETKIDSIEKHGATKNDISEMQTSLIKWFVGTALVLSGVIGSIVFGLTKLIL